MADQILVTGMGIITGLGIGKLNRKVLRAHVYGIAKSTDARSRFSGSRSLTALSGS